jgi:hypothetical protein
MEFYTSIGIKQTIRYEWMQYVVRLLETESDEQSIREKLKIYLSEKKGNGETGNRSEATMTWVVTILMNTWVSPKDDLKIYRDKLLKYSKTQSYEKMCHWSMISAAYPFWFNICYIFGSLFKIQNQITRPQIMKRISEILGERNTVGRCSRFVIRSLVSWGIIKDSDKKGVYKKGNTISITDSTMLSLLFESALFSINDNKIQLSSLNNCPAFFLFDIPSVSGTQISRLNDNIILEHYSIDNEYLSLKKGRIHYG